MKQNDSLHLPVVTPDFKGIGGTIKSIPGDFIVDEIPLYEPSGEGEHIYVNLTRQGSTTRSLQEALAKLFGLKTSNIGYAGLKDKDALATQTFSLHLPVQGLSKASSTIESCLSVRVNWISRHGNKLRVGHLVGNHFTVRVRGCTEYARELAIPLISYIQEKGFPNYFGIQRVGVRNQNVKQGRKIVMKKNSSSGWKRKFFLSSFQAGLFNEWLSRRIQRGDYHCLIEGDVAKKTDSGGLFVVRDLEREHPRFSAGEITYTGPIFGEKMVRPEGRALDLENEILRDNDISEEMFKDVRLKGSRRAGKVYADNLNFLEEDGDILLTFSLPKGSYATALLREFMKDGTP